MNSLTGRVAAYFKSRPGIWIDGMELAKVGGCYASRSRISDCRIQLGMTIENRQRRIKRTDGSVFTVSEYRLVPAVEVEAVETVTADALFHLTP